MVRQLLYQLRHRRLRHVDSHMRMLVQESFHRGSYDADERERHTDSQFTAHHIPQFIHTQLAEVSRTHGILCQGEQRLSCLRKRHLMTVAVEKRLPQFPFQLQDLVRESALRDKQFLGSRGEIQRFCQMDKRFQLSQFHIVCKYSLSPTNIKIIMKEIKCWLSKISIAAIRFS